MVQYSQDWKIIQVQYISSVHIILISSRPIIAIEERGDVTLPWKQNSWILTIFLDRDGYLHCQMMKKSTLYWLPLCSWVQSCIGKSYVSNIFIFSCDICRIMVCWDLEILLPAWQHGITTSPLHYLLLCHSSATATFIRSCLLSTPLSASIALNWIPNPALWSICRMLSPNTISGREGSSSSAEILHMINRKK